MSVATIKPEIKARWVEALRSGRYAQGRAALAKKDYFNENKGALKHCCLGVLCELAVEDGVIERFDDNSTKILFGTNKDSSHYSLPAAVVKWAGMKDDVGTYDNGPVVSNCLAGQNDYGKSFSAIADIIESEFADA